jgi:hypothetical protein
MDQAAQGAAVNACRLGIAHLRDRRKRLAAYSPEEAPDPRWPCPWCNGLPRNCCNCHCGSWPNDPTLTEATKLAQARVLAKVYEWRHMQRKGQPPSAPPLPPFTPEPCVYIDRVYSCGGKFEIPVPFWTHWPYINAQPAAWARRKVANPRAAVAACRQAIKWMCDRQVMWGPEHYWTEHMRRLARLMRWRTYEDVLFTAYPDTRVPGIWTRSDSFVY